MAIIHTTTLICWNWQTTFAFYLSYFFHDFSLLLSLSQPFFLFFSVYLFFLYFTFSLSHFSTFSVSLFLCIFISIFFTLSLPFYTSLILSPLLIPSIWPISCPSLPARICLWCWRTSAEHRSPPMRHGLCPAFIVILQSILVVIHYNSSHTCCYTSPSHICCYTLYFYLCSLLYITKSYLLLYFTSSTHAIDALYPELYRPSPWTLVFHQVNYGFRWYSFIELHIYSWL